MPPGQCVGRPIGRTFILPQSIRDAVLGSVMLVIAALLWIETTRPQYDGIAALNYGFPPSFYPRILLTIWIAMALAILVKSRRTGAAAPVQRLGHLILYMVLTAAYVLLVGAAGFLLASIPFTAAFMLAMGYRQPVAIAVISILFPIVVWWVMTAPLKIVLPTSPWFQGF